MHTAVQLFTAVNFKNACIDCLFGWEQKCIYNKQQYSTKEYHGKKCRRKIGYFLKNILIGIL